MNPGNTITRAEIQAELIGTLLRLVPIAIIVHPSWHPTGLPALEQGVTSHAAGLADRDLLLDIGQVGFLVQFLPTAPTHFGNHAALGSSRRRLSWIFGLAWAIVPILFLDPAQPANLVIITVILVGLNAQALMAVVSYPPAHFASVLVLLFADHGLATARGDNRRRDCPVGKLESGGELVMQKCLQTLNHSLQLR